MKITKAILFGLSEEICMYVTVCDLYIWLYVTTYWWLYVITHQIALVDSDEQVDEDDGWEFVPLSDQQKFGVKTAGLEDKNTACQVSGYH